MASWNSLITLLNFIGMSFATLFSVVLFYGTEPNAYTWHTVDGEYACDPHYLERPLYSLDGLATFATDAVMELNDYDFLSWDVEVPPLMNEYFTAASGRAYMRDFSTSSLLRRVQRDFFTVRAQIARPAIVTSIDETTDRHSWQVQVPARIFYLTGGRSADGLSVDNERTQLVVFTVTIVEQPPSRDNRRGIAITSYDGVRVNRIETIDRMLQSDS